MACTTALPDKPLVKRIRTTATSPHGLAEGKARVEWRRLAEAALGALEQQARDWRSSYQCPPPCEKGGTGQVAVSNRKPRCFPDAKGNNCVCVGYVSVEAWVECLDPAHASAFGEGTVEGETLDVEFA